MTEETVAPSITPAGNGNVWDVVGEKIACKAAGEQAGQAYAVVESGWRAASGTTFIVPRRVTHSLRNVASTTSRMLVTQIPAGFEKFFEAADGVSDGDHLIAGRYDVRFLPATHG